jgi:hypothetical protein
MSTTVLFARRFLSDYYRNPVNLLVLVLVPMVFVVVAAGSLADAAELLGGAAGGTTVPIATAGWAAGFLAGIAMYFQVSAARDADRRAVLAGLPVRRMVAARLLTGVGLAALAATAALLALQLRTGIDQPVRAAAGTLMFATIYLAIGAVVGALVRNPVNGTVLILFVWIIDIFLGPTMGTQDTPMTRALPTHFVSLWMVELPSRHGGRLGDLGIALTWTTSALALAWVVVATTTRVAHRRRGAPPGSVRAQLAAAARMAWRDWRRNPVLWVLLVAVPAVFILLSDAVTPNRPAALSLVEDGRRFTQIIDIAHIHAGTMAPVAVASLATLAGMYAMIDAGAADRRLTLAGLRPGALLSARLAVVALAATLATAASLAVTATVFQPHQWAGYAAANLLIAFTYALIGVLIGPIFGRVAGVFIAFLIPFLDLGIVQSPMLRDQPADWAQALPGYGASRMLIDTAVTAGFDETRSLLVGLGWLLVAVAAATVVFRRTMRYR